MIATSLIGGGLAAALRWALRREDRTTTAPAPTTVERNPKVLP
ncbi:hypothetical protein [Streptomyces sp. NPDC014676]